MRKLNAILILAGLLVLLPFATIAAQGKGGKDRHKKNEIGAADTAAKKAEPAADPKEMEARLMMVDALLELNEAMLEGVKASIDTLNLPENTQPTKNKDLELLRSKRVRDKTLLMPYLEHIQDSIKGEIATLKLEKKSLENVINPLKPITPVVIKSDTLVAGTDTVVYQTTIDKESGVTQTQVQSINTKEGDMTKQDLAKADEPKVEEKQKKKKDKEKEKAKPAGMDTVIVFDVVSKEDARKARNEAKYRDTSYLAKAASDTAGLKIKLPNSNDSIVIKPVKKAKAKEEPVALKPDVSEERTDVVTGGTKMLSQDSIQFIKAEFFLQRAKKAIDDKNLRNAEQYLTKSIELYPNYYEARITKANLDVAMGNYSDALKEFKACEELDKSKPEVYYGMGMLSVKLKKKPEAMDYFTKAIKLKPGYVDALMERAALLTDARRYIEAIIDYDHVVKSEITFFAAYKARGSARMMIKDYGNAADDFTRYLIFEPNSAEVYHLRGLARIANNELMDGCLDLSTAAEKGYKEAEKAIKKNCE